MIISQSYLLASTAKNSSLTDIAKAVMDLCKGMPILSPDSKQEGSLITKTPFPWGQPTENPHPAQRTQQTGKDITTQHPTESCCIMSPFSRQSKNHLPTGIWGPSPSCSTLNVFLSILVSSLSFFL